MKIINIYTDGACSGNQSETNIGGWGALLEYGSHEKELWGGEINTTNNRMEMKALIAALRALKQEGLHLRIFSDSAYLMDCFRKKWYVNWQKNNWKTSQKTDVENRELWEELLQLLAAHKPEFYRVKGHVNLKSKVINKDALYEKFVEWNGESFQMEDFLHVTEMNNRADGLANRGIDEQRAE
ncbi:MAG: ribonuclease HI [Firmicutes bacterium]|nr:ribonuclease HI [Bacillota bacterium]